MEGGRETRPAFAALEGRCPQEVFDKLPTPCYVIDEKKLRQNGEILSGVQKRTGCKILLAQKAFSNYDFYPLLAEYLAGTEASGLYEARLGAEKMPNKENHVFCAAYREEEFVELLNYADHIVFNSIAQLEKFGRRAKQAGKGIGLRINPQYSTQEGHAIYDPCARGSRLGVTRQMWDSYVRPDLLELLDGVHFHTLCEQNADDLIRTVKAVEERFGDILPGMKWLNMGGGHHITRPDYQIEALEACVKDVQEKWQLQVYLEPGEAVALNAGFLVSRVLDVVENEDVKIAILDVSAACHMPDVIEMPYMPPIYAASEGDLGENVYRLAGPTCLAGDVVGDYAFEGSLQEGSLVLFGDMAIYTTCKNNTFNGMLLPNIWKRQEGGELVQLTNFDYTDFRERLGS